MFKFIKFLFKNDSPSQCHYTDEELSMLKLVERCQQMIADNTLDISGARRFMFTLPTHYCEYGRYKDSVHNLCNECHKKLWRYCKDRGLIDDIGYKEFKEKGLVHFRWPKTKLSE